MHGRACNETVAPSVPVQLQIKYQDEQARCISLSVQLDDMRKRAEAAEAHVAKLRGLPDQVTALQVRGHLARRDVQHTILQGQGCRDR